jgi:hypothetical protein
MVPPTNRLLEKRPEPWTERSAPGVEVAPIAKPPKYPFPEAVKAVVEAYGNVDAEVEVEVMVPALKKFPPLYIPPTPPIAKVLPGVEVAIPTLPLIVPSAVIPIRTFPTVPFDEPPTR